VRRTLRFKIGVVAGIGLGLLALVLGLFGPPSFSSRWGNLTDGMTQEEVSKTLGNPTSKLKTTTIGAGGQQVTEWEYKRGRWTYYVDFDYIGPGGAPLVFRTERYRVDWDWPSWLPWQRVRARA